MKKISLSTLAILTLSSITSLSAMQFQTVGYKSVSMGGAAVASSSSSVGSYNNPALLGKSKYDVEVSLSGGVSVYDHGAGASMASLDDTGFIDSVDRISQDTTSITQSDIDNIYAGKDVILNMDGDAVQVSPQASLGVQAYGFGFGVYGTSDAVVTAIVSQAHDKIIFENTAIPNTYVEVTADGTLITGLNSTDYQNSSIEYAMENGLTYGKVVGIGIVEVPLAYGHKIPSELGNLYVGGSVKYMSAVTYTEEVRIDNSTDNSSVEKDLSSTNFGIDVGLAFEPKILDGMTIGLVAKNLNSPSFDILGGSEITIDPMVRVGVAYDVFDSLELAVDMDITSNETFIPDVDSKMIGGGVNYYPTSWFSLRGGLMQNMDSSDNADLIYTAGLGFGLKWFQIDLSGQMSSEEETVNGTTYPRQAKVNLAIVSRW